MSYPDPLAKGARKSEFLERLNMPSHIYNKMGTEVERIYEWLTTEPSCLKPNSKRSPPYDYNDMTERAIDDAIHYIVSGAQNPETGDPETAAYWNLAAEEGNWIAKWFLWHKFRYRDGRSRGSGKGKGNQGGGKSRGEGRNEQRNEQRNADGYGEEYARDSGSYGYEYEYQQQERGDQQTQYTSSGTGYSYQRYYDPVRDAS